MSPLDEIAPRLWRFSVNRKGVPPTMTAYVLRDGEDTILVDPPVVRESGPLLAALDEIVRGRVRILVTTPFHLRGSELLWRRWRDRHEVTIFGHEHCATRLDDRSALRPPRGGETLEGGVRVHTVGRPRRAEIPYELPSHRALAFGDTVLGIDGQLRFWPRHQEIDRAWYEQRFLPTLEPLRSSTSNGYSSRMASRCCTTAPARWQPAWQGRRGAGHRRIDKTRQVERLPASS